MLLRESLRRSRSEDLHCGETVEREDDGRAACVIFQCNLPGGDGSDAAHKQQQLQFNCREPSCGALEGGERAARLDDEDYAVDPNFFDEGYSMAGATGFKVWTGSRLLIETLAWPRDGDCDRLKEIQNCIRDGARLIELGCGVGVVGAYLSAMGSQVLLTDLPTLVENAVEGNLRRNRNVQAQDEVAACPSWLGRDGVRIGRGCAACAPLDWTRNFDEQLTREQSSSIDFIVASDVVFLSSMLTSLLSTVQSIFDASQNKSASFLLSFQRRDAKDGQDSVAFTTVDGVVAAVKERGWDLSCLAWRPVTVRIENEDGTVKDDQSEVFVFEIRP